MQTTNATSKLEHRQFIRVTRNVYEHIYYYTDFEVFIIATLDIIVPKMYTIKYECCILLLTLQALQHVTF